MTDPSADSPVLVAVANPEDVEQLVRTAGDLARAAGTHVRIVSVVSKPHSSPFSVYADQTIKEHFARETREVLDAAVDVAPSDVRVEREILVGRSVAGAVLGAIRRDSPRALVIGWQRRRSRTDAILGSNLDRLVTSAPCDLYVERIGTEANGVDSILLPVAGGPHVRPAAVVAKAVAARNDATVHVLSVAGTADDAEADGDGEPAGAHEAVEMAGGAREDIESALKLIEDAPGPDVAVEKAVQAGDDVVDVLVEAADDHDVLVFGVTRKSAIHRRLVGSIPQAVIPRTEVTVLLARSADAVSEPRFERLRGLWRRS